MFDRFSQAFRSANVDAESGLERLRLDNQPFLRRGQEDIAEL